MHILTSRLYLMSKWTYFKYFEMFKMAAFVGFGRVFKPEVVPEVESKYILRFCSMV